jgi:hypothetical protein
MAVCYFCLTMWSGASAANASQIIYDVMGDGSSRYVTFHWGGDEIDLASGPRILSRLSINFVEPPIRDGLLQHSFDFAARILANDGPDGSPHTLLWDSGTIANQPFGNYTAYHAGSLIDSVGLDIPFISVPDRVTVLATVLETRGAPGYDITVEGSDPPPTTGAAVYEWSATSDLTTFYRFQAQNALVFQLTAVPEPNTGLLAIVASAAVSWRSKRFSV